MRRIRYQVAASLDGYIAGPQGEADWIVADPEIDFEALWAQFDTLLIGRRTFDAMGRKAGTPGTKVYVFSQSLQQSDHPRVTIVDEISPEAIAEMKAQPGKDIWLFGGGELFRSLLEAGLVDTVEIAVIPVLLGGGIPVLPAPAKETRLKLIGHRLYSASGIMLLEYAVA